MFTEYMAEIAEETKKKILESAKNEFLKNGFTNASLRTIASNAGLTTGAMYRHFKDKDALFCALVDDIIDYITLMITKKIPDLHNEKMVPGGKKHHEEEAQVINDLLDFMYKNFDSFTLLFTKAAGSTHEKFLDEIADMYTKTWMEIIQKLKSKIKTDAKIDPMLIHVLATNMVTAFAEIIVHKMKKNKALEFIKNITEVIGFGFMHLVGITVEE